MGRRINLGGKQFGHLTASYTVRRARSGLLEWRCRCSCGSEVWVRSDNLRYGHSKSCGLCVLYDCEGAQPVEDVSA